MKGGGGAEDDVERRGGGRNGSRVAKADDAATLDDLGEVHRPVANAAAVGKGHAVTGGGRGQRGLRVAQGVGSDRDVGPGQEDGVVEVEGLGSFKDVLREIAT